MPYIIRKKIQEVSKNPIVLEILFNNEKVSKYHQLDTGVETSIRCTVTLLMDENCYVKRAINKQYDFKLKSTGAYRDNGLAYFNRRLILPTNLVRDYAIDANMGIELELNEVIYTRHYGGSSTVNMESIFSEERVEGTKDFEIKGVSGVVLLDSELLITTAFDDKFYEKLKLEINTAFRVGLDTATMVLVRKLFERLIIDLLRQKYGMGQKELFYSVQDNGFHNLSTLIRNLNGKLDDFKPYDFFKSEKEKESFTKFLWHIKEEGNASAHGIEPLLNCEEINALKPLINKYSDLSVRLIKKVKETPN